MLGLLARVELELFLRSPKIRLVCLRANTEGLMRKYRVLP